MNSRHLAILCVALCSASPAEALAHDHRSQHIDHDSHLRVDDENVDVQVTLLFHTECAFKERQQMDQDSNALISDEEQQRYLDRLMPKFAEGLEVFVDDHRGQVVVLYDPRIDLKGSHKVDRSALEVHLAWFARLPKEHRHPEHITVVNRLWPETPMYGFWQCESNGAVRLERIGEIGASVNPRTIQIRCRPLSSIPAGPKNLAKETDTTSEANAERVDRREPTSHTPLLSLTIAALILAAAGLGCVYYRRCRPR